MLKDIQKLVKHTAVYSLGSISTKVVGFVLLPLYTKHMTIDEYGVLGLLETTIQIAVVSLQLGLHSAFLRWYAIEQDEERKRSILFSTFSALFGVLLMFNLLSSFIVKDLSVLFFDRPDLSGYFILSFAIASLDILNILNLNLLRIEGKALRYSILNIVRVIIVLSFTVFFVASKGLGVLGILYGQLIGSFVLFLLNMPYFLRHVNFKFDLIIIREMFHFGLPLIAPSLCGVLLTKGNRYILKYYCDYKEIGLYTLGDKLSSTINILLIQPFTLGYLPTTYRKFGEERNERFYSKVLTYLCFALCLAVVALSAFSKEIIETFARNKEYWGAYTVVPVIAAGYVFHGIRYVLSLGMYLTKKTRLLAVAVIIATVLNIALNFLLIPSYKIMGAAVATGVSFFILAVQCYYISNRYYKIPYEIPKLAIMFLVTLGLISIGVLIDRSDTNNLWLVKFLLPLSFPFILYLTKFYEPIEIKTLRGMLRMHSHA